MPLLDSFFHYDLIFDLLNRRNTAVVVMMVRMMKIDTYNRFHVAILLLIVYSNCSLSAEIDLKNLENNKCQGEPERESDGDCVTTQIVDAAHALFSLQTSSYQRIKTLFLQQASNMGFRGHGGGIGVNEQAGEGVMEKMKEAVVKSLDRSRATVEDSAKSAAKFAEAAVDKTVNRLKKSSSAAADHQAEL